VRVRPGEVADQAAGETFLARHNSLRVARLGKLVHPLDHPAFVAETVGGQLLGMLTYVPGQDWQQCEILTLHAGDQWHGGGDRFNRGGRAVGQAAGGVPACGSLPPTTTLMRYVSTSAAGSAWWQCTGVPLIAAVPASSLRSPRWAPTGSRCVTRSSSNDNPDTYAPRIKGALGCRSWLRISRASSSMMCSCRRWMLPWQEP
jgi:hypothetical protein